MKMIVRIGASRDEIEIDGHVFDRSKLDRHQRRAMAEVIVERLYPKRKARKARRGKAHA